MIKGGKKERMGRMRKAEGGSKSCEEGQDEEQSGWRTEWTGRE